MRLSRLVLAASIAAIVAAPAFAAHNPAANLSLAGAKSAPAQGSGDHAKSAKGHTGTIVLAAVGVAAVVGGAVALGTSHHSSMPASN
jgi:hypothetical protein